MPGINIGTCSWKYESWRGLVYSDKPRINYLAEYAQKYDTVEVDQWFWSLHGPDKVSLPFEGCAPMTIDRFRERLAAV